MNSQRNIRRSVILISGIFLGALTFWILSCRPVSDYTVIDAGFNLRQGLQNPADKPVHANIIWKSLKKTGRLYTMVFSGDYSDIMRAGELRTRAQTGTPGGDNIPGNSVSCSSFVVMGQRGMPLAGRNFDNAPSEPLVFFCRPSAGYRSVGIMMLRQIGIKPGDDFSTLSVQQRAGLLYAPFSTCEGMNEKGVFAALNYVGGEAVSRIPLKPARFVTHWVREILDHAADLDQAVQIATSFQVYDNGKNFLCHNVILADSRGESAVVEYKNRNWQVIRTEQSWQVLTNFRQSGLTEPVKMKKCRRYRKAAGCLRSLVMNTDASGAMELLLKKVSQRGFNRATQWSWVANLKNREILLHLKRSGNVLYWLKFPDTD